MTGGVAGRVDGFEVPAAGAVGGGAEVEPSPSRNCRTATSPCQQLRAVSGWAQDGDAIAPGAGRGGADVVGVVVRQDDGVQAPARGCRASSSVEEACLLVGVVGAGVDQVGRGSVPTR